MAQLRKKALWGGLGGVLLLIAATVVISAAQPGHATKGPGRPGSTLADDGTSVDIPEVETIQARRDEKFEMSVSEIAEVQAYFPIPLQAHVAGYVKDIHKSIGDLISKGEVLIDLDVPDLMAAVASKQAVVAQRRHEVELAKEQIDVARASEEVYQAAIKQRQADVKVAEATRDYRYLRWSRFKNLHTDEGVSRTVVDEEERDYLAAKNAALSADAAVLKATADYKQAMAQTRAAIAESHVREALVEVAQRDLEAAKVQADYASIRAPFDGVIVERRVNPDDFVQNSATGHSEPLLSVARVDIVTVVMKVPDTYSHFVTRNTEARIEIRGLTLEGKVTRFSPSQSSDDRTMQVEVDLYNGTDRQEYEQFVQKIKPTWAKVSKGKNDPIPSFPRVSGEGLKDRAHPLFPNDVGKMTLVLRRLDSAQMLPRSVVFTRGGKPHIAEVLDNKVHLLPVEVQMENDQLVDVQVIERQQTPGGGEQKILKSLTGKEAVICNGPADLQEGQIVDAKPTSW